MATEDDVTFSLLAIAGEATNTAEAMASELDSWELGNLALEILRGVVEEHEIGEDQILQPGVSLFIFAHTLNT